MNLLWAPWRDQYIKKCGMKKDKCVFCQIQQDKKDARNYVFLRSRYSYAVLNIYPFSGGHVLVNPNRHVADISLLTADELSDLMAVVLEAKALMTKAFAPEAFNVGINIGAASGAGIPDHLHVHIVPRWRSDINFMPVTCGTKVIPVSLDTLYKRLKDAQQGGNRKKRK